MSLNINFVNLTFVAIFQNSIRSMSEFFDCNEGPSQTISLEESEQHQEEIPFQTKVNVHETEEMIKHDLIEKGLEKDLKKALEAKEQGNNYFRNQDYPNACQYYSIAIDYCPLTKKEINAETTSDVPQVVELDGDSTDIICVEKKEEDCSEYLATFYGNRSAAYYAMEDYELVIDDCTSAIELKPDYTKVIHRRMQSYERLGKIEEALQDAKKLQELDPKFPNISKIV